MIATVALVGVSQMQTAIAFAEIDRQWRPQLSEKILLLPPKHINDASEQDVSKSGLAQNMNSGETQLAD